MHAREELSERDVDQQQRSAADLLDVDLHGQRRDDQLPLATEPRPFLRVCLWRVGTIGGLLDWGRGVGWKGSGHYGVLGSNMVRGVPSGPARAAPMTTSAGTLLT